MRTVIKEIPKEVIKEVPVEVIREVIVDAPREVVRNVDVVREVEVPVYVDRIVEVEKVVEKVVTRDVIKEVPIYMHGDNDALRQGARIPLDEIRRAAPAMGFGQLHVRLVGTTWEWSVEQ